MIQFIKSILTWLLGHEYSSYFTGVTKDNRTDEQKAKDYHHEERVVEAPAQIWGIKITESPYFYEDQHWTSSCVEHGVILAYLIFLYLSGKLPKGVRLSQMFGYRHRSNYPNPGMSPWEAFEWVRTIGACLYDTLPTPFYEDDANKLVITDKMITEAEIFKGIEYYTFTDTKNDINELAKTASTGTAIAITIYATVAEWSREYPAILENTNYFSAPVRHEVCILPNSGFIENGVKYVTIQDSAHFAGMTLRHLSEEFIKQRVYDARYFTAVSFTPFVGTKPNIFISKPLSYGVTGKVVTDLQKCLIYEGLLPSDCATGYFGGRTLAAVRVFQEKYANDILVPNGLNSPTGYVGGATIKKLNSLYDQAI